MRATHTLAIGLVLGLVAATHAASVDITNGNGTTSNQFLSSNGGLNSINFATATDGNVSVWLRARNASSALTIDNTPPLYVLQPDSTGLGSGGDDFAFEFQFTPAAGDTIGGKDYVLALFLDDDPGAGVSPVPFSAPIFAGAPFNWASGDSFVVDDGTLRGGVPVNFVDTSSTPTAGPEYVVANSWKPQYSFLFGGLHGAPPPPGLYDLTFAAYEYDPSYDTIGVPWLLINTPLASVTIQAHVVPVPAAVWGGMMLLGGLGGFRLIRRRHS